MYSVIDNQAVQISKLLAPQGYDLLNSNDPFPYLGSLAVDPNIQGLFVGNGTTWTSVSGDVVGPPFGATDDNIVVFDGTSGTQIKDSGFKIIQESFAPFFLSSNAGGFPLLNAGLYLSKVGFVKTMVLYFVNDPINANIIVNPTVWTSDPGRVPTDYLPFVYPTRFPIVLTGSGSLTMIKCYASIFSDGHIEISVNELTGAAVNLTFSTASGSYY